MIDPPDINTEAALWMLAQLDARTQIRVRRRLALSLGLIAEILQPETKASLWDPGREPA